jgi:hypothetical protein
VYCVCCGDENIREDGSECDDPRALMLRPSGAFTTIEMRNTKT